MRQPVTWLGCMFRFAKHLQFMKHRASFIREGALVITPPGNGSDVSCSIVNMSESSVQPFLLRLQMIPRMTASTGLAFAQTIANVYQNYGVVYFLTIKLFKWEDSPFTLQVHEEAEMTVTIGFDGNTANVILSGNIDYSFQEDLRSANQKVLSNEQVTEICVDFTNVTFLDSSVIRSLLTLQKEADAAGLSLVLANCNRNVRDVFEIGGFDRMFAFR